MTAHSTFAPPPWLRNPHLQSILPTLRWRHPRVARRARSLLSLSRPVVLDCGEGVRLLGQLAEAPTGIAVGRDRRRATPDPESAATTAATADSVGRPLVILLHGWEGSAESAYVLSLGAYLFERGYDIFRLNFRDHGATHALNQGIFHSCRIAEVVGAVRRIQALFPRRRLSLAGFSLGGNFALRVAARAPREGIALDEVVAICPVLRPQATLAVLDRRWSIYRQHFLHKWKSSLCLKQKAFPDQYDFQRILRLNTLTAMTEELVLEHSEFPSLDAYLDGYAIVGDALADLQVSSHVLFALDDPIIPARDLVALARSARLSVVSHDLGGHCGFMERTSGESWADRHVAGILGASAVAPPGTKE